jgi:GTPase SAR1 family protein
VLFETSAKEAVNITESFECLVKQILERKHPIELNVKDLKKKTKKRKSSGLFASLSTDDDDDLLK